MDITDFRDIHTHDLHAGDDALINLPWGMAVPDHGYYSVGIHPWDTEHTTETDLDTLRETARHPRVIAIGEAGMDALRGADLQRQEWIFRQHIALSEQLGKPLIIHAVRTLADVLRLRKELRPKQRWILHGFRGKPATARQLIAQGVDVSLGKVHHPEMPGAVDASHVFFESDAG